MEHSTCKTDSLMTGDSIVVREASFKGSVIDLRGWGEVHLFENYTMLKYEKIN